MPEAVIVSVARTAVGKSGRGSLRTMRPDAMAADVMPEAIERASGLDPAQIEDVVLGCAMPEGEQGLNVARIAALRAGLARRACRRRPSTAFARQRLAGDRAWPPTDHGRPGPRCIVAGGVESMSLVPMTGATSSRRTRAGGTTTRRSTCAMGLTAEERGQRKFNVGTRGAGRVRAALAPERARRQSTPGKFKDEIVPLDGARSHWVDGTRPTTAGRIPSTPTKVPRRDTSLEALASSSRHFTRRAA